MRSILIIELLIKLLMKTIKSASVLFSFILLFFSCQNNPKKELKTEPKKPETEYTKHTFKLKSEEISYRVDSLAMKGYLAYNEDSNEKHPGVMVVHEWWGHNEYVRERADMLAKLGYVALAIDMYGEGNLADHPKDAGKFSQRVMGNIPVAKSRFNAALEILKKHPAVASDKIAAIGYCFGGSVALTMANTGADLDAVAAFHSGVALPVMPNKKLKAKVLVCNGADDPFISAESVTAFKKALDSINADYKYIAYEDAVHSFTSKHADKMGKKFNLPLAYQKEADEKSWEELQHLLNSVFHD